MSDKLKAAFNGLERTHYDMVRDHWPELVMTNDDIDHFLWEHTPFPLMMGAALLPYFDQSHPFEHGLWCDVRPG